VVKPGQFGGRKKRWSPLRNAYEVVAFHIFETSDAEIALIDDEDLSSLPLASGDLLYILDYLARSPSFYVDVDELNENQRVYQLAGFVAVSRTNILTTQNYSSWMSSATSFQLPRERSPTQPQVSALYN